MRWIAQWLAEHPEQRDFFQVQSGSSTVLPPCSTTKLLKQGDLAERLMWADVVVCHGGPGSALDCWNHDILPIVVPRLRAFGEVVDDHQVDFCKALDEDGRVVMAESYDDLRILLEKATADPSYFALEAGSGNVSVAVTKFAELVGELVDHRPGSHGDGKAHRRFRRPHLKRNHLG